MEDSHIVELYWQRNEKAIEYTAVKYGAYCRSIAWQILGVKEDTEEVVNDTYLAAWNSIPPHKPTVLATFLGKLSRRIAVSVWRKSHADKRGGGQIPLVFEELQECISSPEVSVTETAVLRETVQAFLNGLPEIQRRVFLCRYWYAEPIETIAERFGFSNGKVKSMLYRLRERLKSELQREGF